MKLIAGLMGLGALLAVTGCESDYHEHGHHGGTYDHSYRSYGHEAYPYDDNRSHWEHRDWEHRDWNY